MANLDRLDALFERHLDGLLTTEEEEEFEVLLAAPEHRRHLRRATALVGGLMSELWHGAPPPAVLRSTRRRRSVLAATGLCAAVAGALLLIGSRTRVPSRVAPPVAPLLTRAAPPLDEPVPAQPAKHAPSVALVATDEVVFDLMAEARRVLTGGRMAGCPPGAGVRLCFAGQRFSRGWPDVLGLQATDHAEGLFTYEPDLLLTFDYWLGESTTGRVPEVTSLYYLRGAGPNRGYGDHGLQAVRGRWGHATVPLDTCRNEIDDGPGPPGSRVDAFHVAGRYMTEDVIFFANVRIVRGARRTWP